MAAEGFRLVIPQEMLNRLSIADEKLEKLGRTSEATQQKIVASFRGMTDGIQPFIDKITQAQQQLSLLSQFRGGNINLGNVSVQATQNADAINKLVDSLVRLTQENIKLKSSFGGLTDAQLGKLETKQKALNYRQEQNAIRELVNAEKERERQLIRNDKINQCIHTAKMSQINAEIKDINRLSRAYSQIPRALSTKDTGRLIARSVQSDKSINQSLTAIKNLEKAKRDLDTTDKRYAQTLAKIDSEINRHRENLRRLGVETDRVRRHQSNLMNHAQQLRRSLALVFSVSQITGYINKLIQVRGEFELQQRSLRAILQDRDAADKIWQQTVDLAVRSPFRVKELVTYTKQLAAYRVETEKLHETTRMLSDVSAGLGVDMQRLILAFGQVKAANYLRGTELRQFSEAGINILGELAKYFTELEGRAVSVGEVFERVSKRMVAFSDVEEIFKRITSEGGIFYRMQELQSETVKGLISNLYDQIDLMLNDIGKSNDGVLKGAIGVVKEFVESWREVVFVLEKVGYAFLAYTAWTKLAKLGTTSVAQSFLNLTGITSRSVKSLNAFQKVLAGLGTLGYGAVLAGLAYWLLEIYRVSTKASREAERLQKELKDIYSSDYSAFERQTKNFNDLVEKLKNVNQGSQEHRDIIGQINSQYGEYLGYIVNEATSYDKLKASVNSVNEALLRKAKMNTYEKAYAKIFEDTNKTISSSVEKLKKDIKSVTVKKGGLVVLPTEDEINDIVKILEERLKNLGNKTPLWSDIQEAFKEYGLELEQIRGWSNRSLLDLKNALITQKEAELKLEQQINAQYSDTTAKTIEHRNALKQIDEIEKDRIENAKKQGGTSSIAYQKEVDRIKKEAQISRIQAEVEYEGLDKDVAKKRIDELNKFSNTVIDINKKIEESSDRLGEKYASIIYIDEAEAATGISQIAENTAQAYKAQQELIKQQNALKEAGTVYDAEVLDNAEKTAKAYYYKLELLGRLDLLQDKTTGGASKELQLLNKQLAALKESKQTFDNLRQKFGFEEATERTAKAFKELFSELDMTEFTIDMTFDNQGIIDVIEEIPNKAGKAGEQAKEKLKSELKGGLDVDVKIRNDKTIVEQLEDLFSGYELSLELQKLNIPPNIAKQLFNVDAFTLPQLKTMVKGMGSQFVGTDMEDKYHDALRKIDEMERKAQEERLKTYSKYLVKGMDERVRIKLEELRKLEEVEKDKDVYTDEQRIGIRKSIQKEAQEALDKNAWEEFKKSDIYISLFEDLNKASNQSLETMIDRLNSLRNSLSELPATQLKEIVTQLEKAKNELDERNPFKKFANDINLFFGNIGGKGNAESGIKELGEQLNIQSVLIEQQEDVVAMYERKLESGQEMTDEEKLQLENARAYLRILKNQKTTLESQQTTFQKVLDDIKKGAVGIGDAFVDSGKFIQEVGSFVDDISGKWESAFGLSDTAKAELETISGVAKGLGETLSSVGQGIMTGDWLSAGMGAVSGIMSIASTLGQAHDKRKERQIESEIKLVERLKDLYEDLGKTIENAYSLDTLNEATEMSKENIIAQINATERMISAEKDKKKTDNDRIDEWKKNIEELKDTYRELEETRLQELGAFASEENKKSSAEAFVDAWIQAYKETGDGLIGLNEQFDEFFEDMVKKQLLQRGTQKYLDDFFTKFDKTVDEISNGTKAPQQGISEILSEWQSTSPELNSFLEKLAEALGVAGEIAESTSGLGGLQAGISGITEEQADVLAAYWSSVRLYTADTNAKVNELVSKLFGEEVDSNPILAELRAQTAFVREIRDVLSGVVRGGHTMGGQGLKVFVS